MKAWRNPKNQKAYRKQRTQELLKEKKWHDAADMILGRTRVGKAMRDQQIRILPIPSLLLQRLMLRAGVWPTVEMKVTGTVTGRLPSSYGEQADAANRLGQQTATIDSGT